MTRKAKYTSKEVESANLCWAGLDEKSKESVWEAVIWVDERCCVGKVLCCAITELYISQECNYVLHHGEMGDVRVCESETKAAGAAG